MVSIAGVPVLGWGRGGRRTRRVPGAAPGEARKTSLSSWAGRETSPEFTFLFRDFLQMILEQGLPRSPSGCPPKAALPGHPQKGSRGPSCPRCHPEVTQGREQGQAGLFGDRRGGSATNTCRGQLPQQWPCCPFPAPARAANQRAKVFSSLTKFQCLPNSIAVIPSEKDTVICAA